MSFRLKCPTCGQVHSVSEHLAGNQVKCTKCGWPVKVPHRKEEEIAPERSHESRDISSLRVKCPSCGQVHSTTQQLAGRRIKCRNCSGTISIPAHPQIATTNDEFWKDVLSTPAETATPPSPVLDGDADLQKYLDDDRGASPTIPIVVKVYGWIYMSFFAISGIVAVLYGLIRLWGLLPKRFVYTRANFQLAQERLFDAMLIAGGIAVVCMGCYLAFTLAKWLTLGYRFSVYWLIACCTVSIFVGLSALATGNTMASIYCFVGTGILFLPPSIVALCNWRAFR